MRAIPDFEAPKTSFHCPSLFQNTFCKARQTALQPSAAHSSLQEGVGPGQQPEYLQAENMQAFSAQGKHLLTAGGLFVGAMLLRLLPTRIPTTQALFPADWKVWARVGLGIAAAGKLNQALDWRPPAWVNGIEAVTVMTPLISGFTKKSLAQWAVMAPLVAGMVQLTSLVSQKITEPASEQLSIPPWLTRLGLSIGMIVLGVKAYPTIFKRIAETGILGKAMKAEIAAGKNTMMMGMATCARGCSPGSVICLSETGEMLGSFWNWFKGAHHGRENHS